MSVYENLTETQQFACRVIADHARSTAFSIADGILPGNEGRNYVLRKIMRRAIYHGREHLGLKELFFHKVCDFVIEEMHGAYPELEVQKNFIGKMVRLEEERFANTLIVGLKRFEEETRDLISIETLIRNLVWSVESDFNNLDQAVDAVETEHENRFGFGDMHEKLGRLLIKHRLPPYLALQIVRAITEEDKIKFPEGGFSLGQLASALYLLLKDEEDLALRSLTNLFDSENPTSFLHILDSVFPKNDDSIAYPSFKEIARNYDTYGTPRDLIRIFLQDRGITLEEDYFNESFDFALQNLQQQGDIGKTERKSQISPIYAEVQEKIGVNNFHGYDATNLDETSVVAIIKNEQQVDLLAEGEEGLIVLSDTPFYAEAGGQVGDTGVLVSAADGDSFTQIKVIDTFSPVTGLILHKSRVEKGSVSIGDKLSARVDVEKRDATRRNHTATHLVHAALREVLGTHVKQGGSVVAPSYLRFDFTHYQPMTPDEIAEVEDLVNHYILKNEPVNTNVMAIEEAMRGGAMALFGEKYGADVRVLSVGDGIFSKELCGGTHVRATGDIGSFKITADEAIASGVRRIRAITGFDAFQRFREDERLIDRSLGALKTQRDNLPAAIERLQEELKRTRKEMDDLKLKIATGAAGGGSTDGGDEARDISGVKVLARIVEGLDANATRQLSDTLLARLKSGVIVLGRKDEGKVGIIVRVSPDLTGKVKAGEVIREIAPIVGGRGGGKPDMAEGGGSEPDKLSEAIDAGYVVIEKMIG